MRILWSLMSQNNNENKKNLQRNEIYLFVKSKEKSSAIDMEKLDILSGIVKNNNSNHSNIFRELYR